MRYQKKRKTSDFPRFFQHVFSLYPAGNRFFNGFLLIDGKSLHEPAKGTGTKHLDIFFFSGPLKLSAFQTFVKQQKSISFPKKPFYSITSPSTEEKQDILLKGIQIKLRFYSTCKSVNTISEIRISTCNVNLRESSGV